MLFPCLLAGQVDQPGSGPSLALTTDGPAAAATFSLPRPWASPCLMTQGLHQLATVGKPRQPALVAQKNLYLRLHLPRPLTRKAVPGAAHGPAARFILAFGA